MKSTSPSRSPSLDKSREGRDGASVDRTHARAPRLRPEEPTASPSPSLIELHSVPAYFALTFAISWGGILLAVGPDRFFATGTTMVVAGVVSLAGPSVAGVLLTGLVDGRSGLRRLISRLRRWRVGARWYAVALLTGPLVLGATVFGISLASPKFRPDIVTADDKLGIALAGIAVGLVGPLLEEIGWTGFAPPRLRRHHGIFTTGLVMGLLWGAWHFPLLAGDSDPQGIVPDALLVAALLFAWLVPYRVLMVWVYDRTGSLLVAYLMHAPITATIYILGSEVTSGTAVVTQVIVWGVAFWMIVATVAWANGGRLAPPQDAAVLGRHAI